MDEHLPRVKVAFARFATLFARSKLEMDATGFGDSVMTIAAAVGSALTAPFDFSL